MAGSSQAAPNVALHRHNGYNGYNGMRSYIVSKDPKSSLWYCHMAGYPYIPVAGSFCEKKADAKEYAKMMCGIPHKVEQIEQRRREVAENA